MDGKRETLLFPLRFPLSPRFNSISSRHSTSPGANCDHAARIANNYKSNYKVLAGSVHRSSLTTAFFQVTDKEGNIIFGESHLNSVNNNCAENSHRFRHQIALQKVHLHTYLLPRLASQQ